MLAAKIKLEDSDAIKIRRERSDNQYTCIYLLLQPPGWKVWSKQHMNTIPAHETCGTKIMQYGNLITSMCKWSKGDSSWLLLTCKVSTIHVIKQNSPSSGFELGFDY